MRQFNITNRGNQACQLERSRELTKRILILFLFSFTSIFSFANTDLQTKAEKAYSNKDYKQAIFYYESILKEGLSSYKLYYNLGNAYYKTNELGKAIYYYELANKTEPNNEDVKNNLRIANEKTIDEIESKENFFLSAIKSGLVNVMSTNSWAWLSILSLIISLSLVFVFLVSKHIPTKRISFFSSMLFLLVFFSSMLLGFSALKNKHQVKFAIILPKETNIKAEPIASTKSKFQLHSGTKVKVLETNEEWTNIKLENGNEGWVKTSDVGLF